ncbi:MAG: FAD-binding oxidoreductase [Patescibacteria group bacterium]
MSLLNDIANLIEGDAVNDEETLTKYSRDTSIFERKPALVVFPKDTNDVSAIVKYAAKARARGENISITARAAGTDMTGGPLTDSIALVFTKYMNKVLEVEDDEARSEAGTYYRDFEKATLAKTGKLLPPYPASRELAAIGGMVANNAGGELTLRFGKIDRFVHELGIVLSDGSRATFRPVSMKELADKKIQQNLEGKIYREIHALIERDANEIESARPSVSKNSSGYALWNVWDRKRNTFDLTQLITGSQGTLALITDALLGLEKQESHRGMLVIFLSDLDELPEIVRRVRAFEPESFESYDDNTFKLATRFAGDFFRQMGFVDMIRLGFAFLPEIWMTVSSGVPKLVLLAEFAEKSDIEAHNKTKQAQLALQDLSAKTLLAFGMMEEKYWKIRRESFALLRKHVHGLRASPFIDDIVVHPDDYPRFLPQLYALLSQYKIMYTIAGHIGDGNFHIIPLVDLNRAEHHKTILELTPKVYELVASYKGSISGEHGDGIIRTPYLSLMFSSRMIEIFAEVKNIFDPLNIFNPGKKVGGTVADIERSMITGQRPHP